jgi:hypothetical protein
MESMKDPITCSNCGEPLENGAAFCGNCGHPIAAAGSGANQLGPGSLAVAAATGGIPSYAVPVAGRQTSEKKAGMALVMAALGIVGGFFIPLVGIGLGLAGLVLATLSRAIVRRRLSLAGIIMSILAVLVGLGSWADVIKNDPRFIHGVVTPAVTKTGGPAVTAQNLITPCYSVTFASKLNIQNDNGSCNMSAYNGATLDNSSDAYKVYGTTSAISSAGFESLAKQAIENDVHENLATFTITQEKSGQFAGSPAYYVTASNGQGVSVVEAAVLHVTSNGDNFFVFVHAANASTIDLNELQANWHWE